MSKWKRQSTRGSKTKIFAGRYAYEKPLGRGAGGSVYLARDLHEQGRPVALKVLTAEACETVQGKMLRREFEILSKLKHPNLVRVYDYGSLPDGGVFLAEEYIDGFSLQDARALFEPEALIDLTVQLLHGLSYLHAMGMIHRDIKPANVMLLWLDDASARPMTKLVDFGLSTMDPTRDTLRGGTRSYMAPEMVRGEKGEQRSDLYSLGVTLYYALCGVLPFGPRSKNDPPPTEEDFRPPDPHRLNAEVPLELSRFTMALLRQVPDLDFADAGEALQALAADAEAIDDRSTGRFAYSLDLTASPVIRGYFERGILSRRIEEDDLLVEWLSTHQGAAMGQMYLIQGVEGAGKSRLLMDVQASAKLEGHRALYCQCPGSSAPYELMLAMVDRLMEVAQSQDILAVEKYETAILVRRMLTKVGVGTAGEGVDPLVEQAWMRSAIEDAVTMMDREKIVFFIDDLHLADRESLRLLQDWYRTLKAKYRPDIVATIEEGDAYARLVDGEGVQVMPIKGVGVEDVNAFFTRQLNLKGVERVWMESVASASKGRPAYIEEVCRYLIETGILRRASASRWEARLGDMHAMGIPGSLRESLRRRISAVGAGGRECLELLAVVGRPLLWKDARSLLRDGGITSEQAEKVLQTVQWRNLVTTDLQFEGRLVEVIEPELGQVVSDMISPEWRRALHRRVGELLARRWHAGKATAMEAASHLERGGLIQHAAPFFELAADLAIDEGRYNEGISAYEKSLLGTDDVSARGWIYLKAAKACLLRFDPQTCREFLKNALNRARSAGPEWLLFRVLVEQARIAYMMGEERQVRECLDELKQELPHLYECDEVRELEFDLCLSQGNLMGAQSQLTRLHETPARIRRSVQQVERLRRSGCLATVLGDYRGALEHYQEAIHCCEEQADAGSVGALYLSYGADIRRMGSPGEAKRMIRKALGHLAKGERPDLFTEALFQLAWTLSAMGSHSSSRRRANEAFRFAELLGHNFYEHKSAILLGSLVIRRRENRSGTLERIDRVLEVMESSDQHLLDQAEVLVGLGEILIELQVAERGPRILQRGRQLAYQIGAQGFLPAVKPK